MMESRAASSLLLLLGVLLLTHLSSQQVLSRRKISKKVAAEPQKDEAIKDIQKQIDDIMKEVNLLKEQQALQTVCLKGTKVQGKCYLADPVKKRYHAASEDCIAKGGTLTTPLSLDENDKLQDYARESIGPDEQIWLGINDMLTEGAWVDQTGSAVRYKNWDAGFKGNDATLNCAVLSGSSYGKWLDENCRQERASVCEFNIV
ncbi:tetranectin-like protein [Engraulis encrasicolus]|uniref:tetranectin-like protein n=1 Tax=Engraulis encrasicolus TaxID=184585 RepID=UPI002FD1B9F0